MWAKQTSASIFCSFAFWFRFFGRRRFLKRLQSHVCDGCSSASHATAPRKFCIYSFWISPRATFQTISTALTLKTTLTRQIFPGRCQLAWNLTTQSSASFTFCLELFCCIRLLIKITCALEVAFLI